jgi:DNA-binding transcriptional regulator YiaG
MPKSKTIAERLKSARQKLNLSQSEAGAAWGINHRTLQTWEQGSRSPRGLYLERVEQILKAAGV